MRFVGLVETLTCFVSVLSASYAVCVISMSLTPIIILRSQKTNPFQYRCYL